MNIFFHDRAELNVSKSENPYAWGRRAMLPNFGSCLPEREPKTKHRFGAMSRTRRTIAFSSESLSPRAKEQLRQLHSKVKGTDNAGNVREHNGWPLGFRHLRGPTPARAWSNLIREISLCSWAISVVSLSSSSTVVCAANLPQSWLTEWLLKRIIYGGLAIFRVTLEWEVRLEIVPDDWFFFLTSMQYLEPPEWIL